MPLTVPARFTYTSHICHETRPYQSSVFVGKRPPNCLPSDIAEPVPLYEIEIIDTFLTVTP